MGLDFSRGNAHWAYSGFSRFRNKLANEIGFPEYKDIEYTDDKRYEKIKDEPLLPLLAHSDCDGFLTVDECKKVAPRLREIVSRWPDNDRDKSKALNLAEGMEEAIKANEPLEFQ